MPSSPSSTSCVVVGAGVSGLLAARELSRSSWEATVVDKGRGVGGRMATRRLGDATFDHGAQFFTSRSERFEALLSGWLNAGAAAEWSRGFAGAEGERPPDGHPRYRGARGMTSVPKHLAEGLDVRTGERVVFVEREGAGWRVHAESGLSLAADALVISAPAPQSLALVNGLISTEKRAELQGVSYAPCLAVMATLDESMPFPEPGGIQVHGEPLDWISDNHRKGISDAPALTVHAGPEWSREHFEDPEDAVTDSLLDHSGEFLGVDLSPLVVETSLARWRYSMVTQNHPERFMVGTEDPPLLFCGDGFGEAKVEGASLSGLAAAEWLLGRDM